MIIDEKNINNRDINFDGMFVVIVKPGFEKLTTQRKTVRNALDLAFVATATAVDNSHVVVVEL